jgi:hypothetical protein
MARSGQEVARESDYLGNVRTQTQGFTALGQEWRCSFPWRGLLSCLKVTLGYLRCDVGAL